MKSIYKISEFASLCGITRDTLLHYDSIGLLKPAFVAENGYRYYTISQFGTLDMISVLKASGTPLQRIKDYLEQMDVEKGISLLTNQMKILEEQERHIHFMRQSIQQTICSLQEGIHCKCGVMTIEQLPEQYLIATPTGFSSTPTEQQFLRVLQEHFVYCSGNGFGARFQTGEIILQQNAKQGKFIESYYFNPIAEYCSDNRLRVKPAGTYAVYYYQGSYQDFPLPYQTFLEQIEECGYMLCGDLYEDDVMDYLSVADPNQYVFRLSALVEPKSDK